MKSYTLMHDIFTLNFISFRYRRRTRRPSPWEAVDGESFVYRRGPWKILAGTGVTRYPRVARTVNAVCGRVAEQAIFLAGWLFGEEYDFRYRNLLGAVVPLLFKTKSPRYQLFNIDVDPLEQCNLAPSRPDLVETLLAEARLEVKRIPMPDYIAAHDTLSNYMNTQVVLG